MKMIEIYISLTNMICSGTFFYQRQLTSSPGLTRREESIIFTRAPAGYERVT